MEDFQAAEEVTARSATGRVAAGSPGPGGQGHPRTCVDTWAASGREQRPSTARAEGRELHGDSAGPAPGVVDLPGGRGDGRGPGVAHALCAPHPSLRVASVPAPARTPGRLECSQSFLSDADPTPE